MPSAKPDRFIVESDGCRLAARSYAPERRVVDDLGVVLVHGLLSAADVFDVPGREDMSLARFLCGQGIPTVSYDQRGTGESTATNWTFGMGEHSLVDLPAVLAVCRTRLGFDRVVFVSHSLGGTIWLRYVRAALGPASAATGNWSDQPEVVGGAVLASPAFFDSRHAPWSTIAARGRPFIDDIDHNGDAIVTREEFVRAQITLYWPWAASLVRPHSLKRVLAWGGRSTFVAGVLRRLPTPTVIYHRDDFDDATFRRVLASKTIDRGPARLLVDLFDEIVAGPPDPVPPPLPFDGLAIGSRLDGFVPLDAVSVFANQFRNGQLVVTERDFGVPSGHVGYLFKSGVRARAFQKIAEYIGKISA